MSWILMTKENDFAINKDKQKWALQSVWHKLISVLKIYTMRETSRQLNNASYVGEHVVQTWEA